MALANSEYTITEAGFGADLGAEKFYNILCRKSGLQPDLTVIVATAQGLKMHGGVDLDKIKEPNMDGLRTGLANLDRHVQNLRGFGQSVVVVFNRFATDTDEEMALLRQHCEEDLGLPFVINNAFALGGEGAVEMAHVVEQAIQNNPSAPLQFTYNDDDNIRTKIEKVAKTIYGADGIDIAPAAMKRIKLAEEHGMSQFPVCIAKTQFSFSGDAKKYGVATGFRLQIKDVVLNAGAEMIVAIAGDILRMPGLPKVPQANHIDFVDGEIVGLS
jgi:formate--tetrahydrofolate ligase